LFPYTTLFRSTPDGSVAGSTPIKKIEVFFNEKLFYRNKLGLYPTPQGEKVIQYAKKTVNDMEKLQENIKSLSNKTSGTIRIGIIRALSMYLLPELLSSFLNKYPDVNINIVTGFSAELMKSLANNYVHLVILREDIEWPYYKKNISSSRISIFSKTPIDFFQLPNLPRINYKTNPSLQTIIEKWWKN